MALPNPHLRPDPFAPLGLAADGPLASFGPAVAAAAPQPDGPLTTPRGLLTAVLAVPWHVPVGDGTEEQQVAWIAFKQGLASHRSLWEKEEAEPAHHDHWVGALEGMLQALAAPATNELLLSLAQVAATAAGWAPPEPGLLDEAKADFLVDFLLAPAAAAVQQEPGRYVLEAACLQTVRTLGESSLRRDDQQRLLRRVLRSASRLWLEVERPDRAQVLLEELATLDPESASVRHFLTRCKLLQALTGLKKNSLGFQLAPIIGRLEELVDESPYNWEVRTQLADLYLAQVRGLLEERRATDAAEAVIKAIITDVAWKACGGAAGDLEGSMHESQLVGGVSPGPRDQIASDQLKTAIRAGFSRGEMYLSRARAYKVFEAWPQAEAARLWFELDLPTDGGTFPDKCLALVEAVAAAPPLPLEQSYPWVDGLKEQVAGLAPELTEAQLDGPVASWVRWARVSATIHGAPIAPKDLLFLHRLRDHSPAAPPLGAGPFYRPVLGFGLLEKPDGLVVQAVKPGSQAEAAGLQEQDQLVRLRGYGCPTTARALLALLGWQPGEALDLVIRRGGKLYALHPVPTEHKELDRLPTAEMKRRCEKLLNLRLDAQLKVLGSPRVGFFCQAKEGDRLLRVDGIPVSTLAELEQAVRTLDMGQFVFFTVLRGGQPKLAKIVTLSFKE